MRVTRALAVVTAGFLSVAAAQPDAVSPQSIQLSQSGFASLAKGQAAAATDSFETALAVDPKNRAAFIGLARAAQAQGLPGKAVKYYREALQLEPNDLMALQGQGEALVQRGARVAAQANLDRIRQLCKGECPQAKSLAMTMAQPVAQAAPAPTPVAKN